MFKIDRRLTGGNNVPLMILEIATGTATSTTWKEGTAVRLASGVLTKCSGDVQAEYIVAETVTTASATATVKVYKVLPDMVFRVPLSAFGSTVKAGAWLTFYTDGAKVTATAASGHTGTVASTTSTNVTAGALCVNALNAAASGDEILVMMGQGV